MWGRRLSWLLAAFLLATPAAAIRPQRGGGNGSCRVPSKPTADQLAHVVFCLVIRARRQDNLQPLTSSPALWRIARRRALQLGTALTRGENPEGPPLRLFLAPLARRLGPPFAVAEATGWGTGALGKPRAILKAWLRSPPHREILLGARWRLGAVGVARANVRGTPVTAYALELIGR